MKLVVWIMACAFGFAVGWLIGTAIINTIMTIWNVVLNFPQ